MKRKLQVGIVGAGLMGRRRAEVVRNSKDSELVLITDKDFGRAKKLAEEHGSEAVKSWRDLVKIKSVDVVIVSTTNDALAPVSAAALKNGKHVLCEKPLGRNVEESRMILDAAQKSGKLLKTGFNHRFHPSILKAREYLNKGAIGKLMFMRARYGHGGRRGMGKEWRARRAISGGGELLDQGTHLIDLMRWFGGEPQEAFGSVSTKFWKTDVEDNVFVVMKNRQVTSMFHVSWTNWGNIFSFEIFGDKGFIKIEGKGGRYGKEKLTIGRIYGSFNHVKEKRFEFEEDTSWRDEWKNFVGAIRGKNKLIGDGKDGLMANKAVEAIYKSSKTGRVIKLNHE